MAFPRSAVGLAMLLFSFGMRFVAAQVPQPEPTIHPSHEQNAKRRTQTVTVKPDQEVAYTHVGKRRPVPATKEIEVGVRARLVQVDGAPEHDGKLILQVFSETEDPDVSSGLVAPWAQLEIRLPLSSAGDSYGESRSCFISQNGGLTFIFTAGLEEANFIPFAESKGDREFKFSLNKYICRALAAPFQCKGSAGHATEVKLPDDMALWEAGVYTSIELSSKGAGAKAEVSEVTITSSGKAFDYATPL